MFNVDQPENQEDKMKIYNLGSLNIDYVYDVEHFVKAGETLASKRMTVFPGGKGLNQSVALSRAGSKVIHGAMIGKDGELLLNTLKASGVDISRIKIINETCGHAIIQVNKNGENCILLFSGANHKIDKEYIEDFLFDAAQGDILLLQNEINALDLIFEAAAKRGMQIAFNPSPINDNIKNLPLSQVNWWFCNEIEAELLFGSRGIDEIKANFLNTYPNSNLILTLGKKGARFINNETDIYQPIYEAEVVDTTAAGDTFTGYFLSSVIKDGDIKSALQLASKASSVTVSRMGASKSIPFIEEI